MRGVALQHAAVHRFRLLLRRGVRIWIFLSYVTTVSYCRMKLYAANLQLYAAKDGKDAFWMERMHFRGWAYDMRLGTRRPFVPR